MKKNQKLFLFTLSAILTLGLLSFLSLPCPFTPLGLWLENLVPQKDTCSCLCPWWLFLLLLTLSCLLLFKVFKNFKKKSKAGYWASLVGLGVVVFIGHFLAHRFYTGKQIFEPSVFCRWFWLMDLAIVFLFGLLPH